MKFTHKKLFREERDGILFNAFMYAATQDPALKDKVVAQNNSMTFEERQAREYDISLVVEGVTVDPEGFLDRLVKNLDERVQQAAADLVEEKLSDLFGKFKDIETAVEAAAMERLLGANWKEKLKQR